jgi:hypothetical protein
MEPNKEMQEILETLRANARKLVILIEHSTMPDDIKESWIALLPGMSINQLDRFLSILEAKYLDEQTRSIDTEYKIRIQSLVDQFQQEKSEEDKEAEKILGNVKKVIELL